ncbi:Chitinase A1 precursor [Poriferisphaera corsica]|uniref:chitinase n=1 Tax=Poriferisphaera corsica TaxID=2528020 RepID=A0A517YSX3_9BACT|nr:glycoside hydrolase family 18 protein [Poriferisphaera corsica]QDU33335.1 Chitinase A1 precursor [Poriferisphaera corsica]
MNTRENTNIRNTTLAACIALLISCLSIGCQSFTPPLNDTQQQTVHPNLNNPNKYVMAYFPEWGGIYGDYTVADIPAQNLTHIFYAFAKLHADGSVTVDSKEKALDHIYPVDKGTPGVRGHLNQLIELKKQYPHLKTLISIGGWELSMHFSSLATTEQGRQTLAQNAVEFMRKYQFDGIDIDWEFPVSGSKYKDKQRPEDKQNFTLLMQDIRDEMDRFQSQDQKQYLLTAAVTVGVFRQKHLELEKLANIFDFVNVMVYDMHGRWVKDQTGHLSALYPSSAAGGINQNINGDNGIQGYLTRGFKPEQVMMGAPLYAAGWRGVSHKDNGISQPAKSLAFGVTEHKGYWEWRSIVKLLLEDRSHEFQLKLDPEAKAAYVWAPTVDGGTWITCPSRESFQAKIDYVNQHNLGGMFFWDVSNDLNDQSHPQALINFTADQLLRNKQP